MKLNQQFRMGGVILSLLFAANTANAQTTLASWTFDTGYTTEGNVYTPNSEASTDVTGWFNAGQPQILPNTFVGAQTDYSLTGKSARYWQFCNGYNNRVLRIENTTEENAITDYTDAAQHLNYYEVNFPATGYKDIKVNWAIAYGGNAEVDINAVVSTDGGTTWAYAGTGATASGWWLYTERSVNLAVANQSAVKVRLLFGNGYKSNWNMDFLNVTGTAITSETFFTATVAADDNSHGTVTLLPAGGIYENGTSVTVAATKNTGYLFKEWQNNSGVKVSEDNPYTFTVTGNTALTAVFVPGTTYTLATSVSPAYVGTVTRSLVQEEYDASDAITLTATPNTGYAFVEWQDGSGNKLSADNPYTFNIEANTTAVAIFQKVPLADNTEITVASWTFNTGYDIDGLVYTPNTNAFAEIAQTQAKNNQVKQFSANAAYGALTDYAATISNDDTGKTYYSIKNNNGDQVLSLFPNKISNDVSDYTDAAQHTVYAQFSFSTLGLKDVKFAPTFTYNNTERNLQLVYSVDGGTTWTDGGACAGGPNWFTYNTTSVSLSADNAESVIVRLLPANGEDGDYRFNSVTVTATVAPRTVTITDADFATYYNNEAVQIPAGVKAYWGKLSDDKTKVELTEITDGIIPANTAVVLEGTADTYTLTTTAEAGSAYASNVLRGVVGNTSVSSLGLGAGTLYVLGKAASTGKAAFCQYTGTTLGNNRAYLFVAGAAARELSIVFGSETTAIQSVSRQAADSTVFDLQGRRVAQPAKGLYIVGGRKAIIK